MRELPETIARLERRIAGLTQDIATAETHKYAPLTIGGRRCGKGEALELLAARLQILPAGVIETAHGPLRVSIAACRFGIVPVPPIASPEICVEGAPVRTAASPASTRGPAPC